MEEDERWMRLALAQGEEAISQGEVPIGAVIIQEGRLLSGAYNRIEMDGDPTAHAEILAIKKAAKALGGWRLTGTVLYVTVEPCPMCAGAILLARIPRVVYGADDPKKGAVGSLYNILQDPRLNHRAEVVSGVLEDECACLIRSFFRRLRKANGSDTEGTP